MATSDRDLVVTPMGGSDVIYDTQCAPCSTEGQNLEATSFCQTCGVLLCTGCVGDHKKNPASSLHHLLDAAAMPRTTTRPKINDVLTARHVTEVNIKTKKDGKDCIIHGIAELSGDRLVVTDWNNVAVKLVDVKANKVSSRLTLSSQPFDIIRTKPDQVAVVMSTMKIEIFTVTDILTRTNTIDVPGTTFSSLCYDGDRFIVLDYQPALAVKILDMTGSIVSTVYKDSDSDPLLKTPRYITLGHTRDVIYVTDYESNTVTCMSLRGRVIWVYKHPELTLLARSGQLVQILLDKQLGLASCPEAICVSEDKLWVSSGSTNPKECNFVRLFQLE